MPSLSTPTMNTHAQMHLQTHTGIHIHMHTDTHSLLPLDNKRSNREVTSRGLESM